MSSDTPSPPSLPAAPPPPPMFGAKDPKGKKPKAVSQQPTFLGSATMPTGAMLGTKTLLGGA